MDKIRVAPRVSNGLKINKAVVIIKASISLLNRFIIKLSISATISPSLIILDIFLEECDFKKSSHPSERKCFKREVFILAPISPLNILMRLIEIVEITIVSKEYEMMSPANKKRTVSSESLSKFKRRATNSTSSKAALRFSRFKTKNAIAASPPTSIRATRVRDSDMNSNLLKSLLERTDLKLLIKFNIPYKVDDGGIIISIDLFIDIF